MGRSYSRREVLRRTAAVGAATAMPGAAWSQVAAERGDAASRNLEPAAQELLEAVVARLIPSDANGPGALEAGAARYIDRALGNALADWRASYSTGLTAIDAFARSVSGRSFVTLDAAAQDALLTELERSAPEDHAGFDMAAFIDLVLGHTIEGTFCDPYYGGNRDFIGWDMIGYPGLRLAVGENEQRMSTLPEPTRVSAYDLPMFEALDPDSEIDGG